MTTRIKRIHTGITIISWLIFLCNLIWLLIAYPSLADYIGTHFGQDGKFDMIDEKKYAFYPFLVSVIVLVIFTFASLLVSRIKLGMKVSSKGEMLVRNAAVLMIDTLEFGIVFFFSFVWNYSVINQVPLNTKVPSFIIIADLVLFNVFLIYLIVVRIRYSSAKNR